MDVEELKKRTEMGSSNYQKPETTLLWGKLKVLDILSLGKKIIKKQKFVKCMEKVNGDTSMFRGLSPNSTCLRIAQKKVMELLEAK